MRRGRITAILSVTVFVCGLVAAQAAFATGTWSGHQPSRDAVVAVRPVNLVVQVASTEDLRTGSAQVYVDGLKRTATLVRSNPKTGKILAAYPASVGLDGPHSASASVVDKTGATLTETWGFVTAIPPVIGTPSPAPGSLVTNTMPSVTVPVSDNSVIASSQVWVNGSPASYVLLNGILSIALPSPLEDDATNTLNLTVTDGVGLQSTLTWTLDVQVNPEMAEVDCGSCHVANNSPGHTNNADDCLECHYTSPHSGAPSAYHPSADVTSCRPCHISEITVEHERQGLACETCHLSTDPAVVAAIRSDDVSCQACHPGAAAHEAAHLATVPAECAGGGCHGGSSLTAVHFAPGSTLSCDSCHESTDPDVVDAIASGDKQCASCHTGDSHAALHETTVSASCEGVGCHAGSNLGTIHAAAGCDGCHDSTDPDVVAAIASEDKQCGACHATEGVDYHSGAATLHASPTTVTCFGAGCHDASRSLPTVHANFAGPGTVHPEYPTACALCHANPAVDTQTSGSACTTACHGSPTHTGYDAGHTVTTESAECTACHGTTIATIHGADVDFERCAVCHANPANGTKNADCASCHAGIDHEALHVTTVPPDCASCHAGSSLTQVHAAPGCAGCHDSTDQTVIDAIGSADKACATCHGVEPHPDLGGTHTATLGSATMSVFTDHWGIGAVDLDVQCTMCHASTQLLTTHGQDCNACHGGSRPVDSFGTWNRSCQQGACHPTLEHTTGPAAHDSIVAGGICETCHDEEWAVPWSACESCHDTSSNGAPVTTSNAVASYIGSATIRFSTPGIAYTTYRLDGGPRTYGPVAVVAGPATGSVSHTIEYWSVDDYGNEELPHKTANFTVSAP